MKVKVRGFLIVIVSILLLLIIAFLVFMLTFDANRYKGVLITKLEQAINKNVKIDDISLNPWQGLAVKIRGISIKDTDKTWEAALLKIANLDVSVKILPLIKKDIQIQNISLDSLMLDFSSDSFKLPISKSVSSDNSAGAVAVLGALKFFAQNIYITNSRIHYRDISQPKPIDLRIDIISAKLKNVSLYGPANIEARLSIFAGGTAANSPGFKGEFNLKSVCSIGGLSQDNILKTLNAKGNIELENGLLENMNVLRVALDKLNMLPGLVERLKYNLPEKYNELLKENHTAFKPMNADFEIKTGRLFFEKLIIESDAFYLVSKGSIGMDGSLYIGSNLFIPQDLSGAFTNAAPELEFLKDDKGIITMPLDIKGKVPNISVMPNLDYCVQKLAVSKGQEILDRIFKGKPSQPDEEGKGSSGQKPVETIIRGVLDIFTKPSSQEGK